MTTCFKNLVSNQGYTKAFSVCKKNYIYALIKLIAQTNSKTDKCVEKNVSLYSYAKCLVTDEL